MRLASRDMLATGFVAISLGVFGAWALGIDLPGLGAVAAVAAVVLLLALPHRRRPSSLALLSFSTVRGCTWRLRPP